MARVMIADDSSEAQSLINDLTQIAEYDVVAIAKDGNEAVQKFQETRPDVVLLDIDLPKKDGLKVFDEILIIDPDVKVIMLTANDDFTNIVRSAEHNVIAYMIKPFHLTDLLNAISLALDNSITDELED